MIKGFKDFLLKNNVLALAVAVIVGGAVGNALGAPVEFMDIAQIRRRFGPGGIRDFVLPTGTLARSPATRR